MSNLRAWLVFPFAVVVILTASLLFSPDFVKVGASPHTLYTLEGRVFAGNVGNETTPVAGVTVSLYGANNSYPDPGVFIRSAVTDGNGWYGLNIEEGDPAYEFYKIIETDLPGYDSAGATSVGGVVQTANWIEYVIPLEGKVLTGNKFWDFAPVFTPTSTPTPTSTQTPTHTPTAAPQICQGRVFEGEVGDEGHPLADVVVELYVANGPYPNPGTLLHTTATDGNGWYSLPCPDGYEFYAIRETDPPNHISVGAASVSGIVRGYNWVEIAGPSLGGLDLSGNKFWDQPGVPTLTYTPTPTLTEIPTSTPTRTPTRTLTPTQVALDLQVSAVELTQGIQCKGNASGLCADNAVPLIAGKTTYVRVYVKVNGVTVSVANVTANAVASTTASPYILATSLNATITAKLSPQRSQYSDTLNFVFSPWDLDESGSLTVTVNPNHTVPESNYSNNSKTVTLTFKDTNPLAIVPVWVQYKYGGANSYVASNMPLCLEDYTLNLLPVGDVEWHTLSGPPLSWTDQISTDAQWGKMLQAIRDLRTKNWAWNLTKAPWGIHYYGMLPFTLVEGNAGLGDYPGWSAIGRVPMSHENLEDGADILVHELGHNFNRQHAPCGVDDPDLSYPWPNAALGDYGWDPQAAGGGKVMNYPSGYVVSAMSSDVMSYCQDEWIGEYTYRGILNYRGSWPALTAGGLAVATPALRLPAQTQPYLFVSGMLGEPLTLDPWAIHEGPEGFFDDPGEGDFILRLFDSSHQLLFERYFYAEVSKPSSMPGESSSPTAGEQFSFYQVVPWNPATAFVQIWHADDMLIERAASPHAPSVELYAPAGGEFWAAHGDYLIEWGASDDDDDPLWFDVAFSPDGGATWQVIATRLQDTYLEVRGDQFPGGGAAMIRVYASDGLLTASATGGAFTIEPKPPMVYISLPQDGAVIPPGSLVFLNGHATDWEDGPLSGGLLQWRSDRDGELGSGEQVLVTLSPGWHEITLTAEDIPGNPAAVSVRVYVGYRLYMPLAQREMPFP